jgi:hypothetical protein
VISLGVAGSAMPIAAAPSRPEVEFRLEAGVGAVPDSGSELAQTW